MENKKSIDLDLERRDFEASGICTTSMFENVMWDQWQFKYVPLVREKKICDNAIKINDRFLGWKAAKSQATPEGFVLMPIKPTETMVMAVAKEHEGEAFLPYSLYDAFVKQAMIEAQEQSHD